MLRLRNGTNGHRRHSLASLGKAELTGDTRCRLPERSLSSTWSPGCRASRLLSVMSAPSMSLETLHERATTYGRCFDITPIEFEQSARFATSARSRPVRPMIYKANQMTGICLHHRFHNIENKVMSNAALKMLSHVSCAGQCIDFCPGPDFTRALSQDFLAQASRVLQHLLRAGW